MAGEDSLTAALSSGYHGRAIPPAPPWWRHRRPRRLCRPAAAENDEFVMRKHLRTRACSCPMVPMHIERCNTFVVEIATAVAKCLKGHESGAATAVRTRDLVGVGSTGESAAGRPPYGHRGTAAFRSANPAI